MTFKVGDWVKVRLPGIIAKGRSKFSDSLQITSVRNRSARLSNGKWWNMEKLSKQRDSGGSNADSRCSYYSNKHEENVDLQRPVRKREPSV